MSGYPTTPLRSHFKDGYETKNIDKAAYLVAHGAHYVDCYFDQDNLKIATVILNNVHMPMAKEFWNEEMECNFWNWKNGRRMLKSKIYEKRLQTGQNGVQ